MPPIKPITPEKALARLQSICARCEISSGEALLKLRRMGLYGPRAEEIVDRLKASRFINDERFAGAFTREKVKYSRWGPRKIAMALRAKGINSDIIDRALGDIDMKEIQDTLRHVLDLKVRTHPELLADSLSRRKLYAYGLSRGFSSSAVSAVIREIQDELKG